MVQLINVDDGFHLWSEPYDRELADVFEARDNNAAISMSIEKVAEGLIRRGADVTDGVPEPDRDEVPQGRRGARLPRTATAPG